VDGSEERKSVRLDLSGGAEFLQSFIKGFSDREIAGVRKTERFEYMFTGIIA
jgi:hypothetical protein